MAAYKKLKRNRSGIEIQDLFSRNVWPEHENEVVSLYSDGSGNYIELGSQRLGSMYPEHFTVLGEKVAAGIANENEKKLWTSYLRLKMLL